MSGKRIGLAWTDSVEEYLDGTYPPDYETPDEYYKRTGCMRIDDSFRIPFFESLKTALYRFDRKGIDRFGDDRFLKALQEKYPEAVAAQIDEARRQNAESTSGVRKAFIGGLHDEDY